MKVEIESCQPDGLLVKFDGLYVDTYYEALELIQAVDNFIKSEGKKGRDESIKTAIDLLKSEEKENE